MHEAVHYVAPPGPTASGGTYILRSFAHPVRSQSVSSICPPFYLPGRTHRLRQNKFFVTQMILRSPDACKKNLPQQKGYTTDIHAMRRKLPSPDRLSALESTAKYRRLTPVLARIRRGRPPSARMRKRASGHRARQKLARHLSTGELKVETKMKSSQKSLYLTPAHKEKNAVQ